MSTTTGAPLTPDRIHQMAFGYAAPLALEAAVRHHVFDVLDNGPLSLNEIHKATGASERGLAAILDFLAGLNFLVKQTDGKYALAAESAAFLVSTKPSFQGGLLKHASTQLMPAWLHLNEVVATGKPVAAVNQEGTGGGFFHELVSDIFALSYTPAKELAAHLGLASATQPVKVLDIGAGSGVWGIALAESSAEVSVTAVDWPEVIDVTKAHVERYGLTERFQFSVGDFQTADFGNGHNITTVGQILHSEGIERSKTLLKKIFGALASGGVIAIAEFLVNADRTGPMNGLVFAINMVVNTDNGNTYSFEEISEWLGEAGFVNARTIPTHGPSPLILATKP